MIFIFKLIKKYLIEFLDSLTGFFHFLMAGLISPHSPSMSSATLLAISRLCLEFKENLAGTIVDELISTLILVLQSKERQIVQSALSFCRVLLIIVNETVLSKYIEQLVNNLIDKFFSKKKFFIFIILGSFINNNA